MNTAASPLGKYYSLLVLACIDYSLSFIYGLFYFYIYRFFLLRVASSMFYMLALPFLLFLSCYFVG